MHSFIQKTITTIPQNKGHHYPQLPAIDLQVSGSGRGTKWPALNRKTLDMLPQLLQMTRIGGLSRSAALIGKGHNWTGHNKDCMLDVAELGHRPIPQTCPWSSWRCEA